MIPEDTLLATAQDWLVADDQEMLSESFPPTTLSPSGLESVAEVRAFPVIDFAAVKYAPVEFPAPTPRLNNARTDNSAFVLRKGRRPVSFIVFSGWVRLPHRLQLRDGCGGTSTALRGGTAHALSLAKKRGDGTGLAAFSLRSATAMPGWRRAASSWLERYVSNDMDQNRANRVRRTLPHCRESDKSRTRHRPASQTTPRAMTTQPPHRLSFGPSNGEDRPRRCGSGVGLAERLIGVGTRMPRRGVAKSGGWHSAGAGRNRQPDADHLESRQVLAEQEESRDRRRRRPRLMRAVLRPPNGKRQQEPEILTNDRPRGQKPRGTGLHPPSRR